ncbi:hypothetical protein ONS95_010972 [Cadophora gregata]|uniref:uncharacterized protein n=1 Tax=Cadophora gregata TaxID=51156 RepID=UPI0026DB18DA|nr:uncharacterized protein ONS95_010972 [Cadophora gregata]KAK0119531.1 hypothetical protein ONS95_010972 [Cadophora gregata]KAK0120571.1 hypothetical protein ONS96_010775 [Cadophora gregata f. sp. sojae]
MSSYIDPPQSFDKRNLETSLPEPLNAPLASVLDGCLKARNLGNDSRLLDPFTDNTASKDLKTNIKVTSCTENPATSITNAEKEWLKKTEYWIAEAYALVHDESPSCED